jgi:hypothetical protein
VYHPDTYHKSSQQELTREQTLVEEEFMRERNSCAGVLLLYQPSMAYIYSSIRIEPLENI